LGVLEDKMGRREISQGYYNKADNLMDVSTNKSMKEMMEEGTTINYDRPSTELPIPQVTEEPKSFMDHFKSVFTAQGLKEFVRFVKAGFKLKD